jgi:hypothetical protein
MDKNIAIKWNHKGWRDGSEVESTVCSFCPEFNSQQPHNHITFYSEIWCLLLDSRYTCRKNIV